MAYILVSRLRRLGGCAHFLHGGVDGALQLVPVGVGVARLDVLNGAMRHAPAAGFFDDFREVAFFHALGAQKGAEGEIGLFS